MEAFDEKVWLIILDKGFLAIALAVVAGLVKWLLQKDQAQRDLSKGNRSKTCRGIRKIVDGHRAVLQKRTFGNRSTVPRGYA